MGQKVHPIGIRLGMPHQVCSSSWYAEGKEFVERVHNDIEIRAFLKTKLKETGIGKIIIERTAKNLKITIFAARPGLILGKNGNGIDLLRGELEQFLSLSSKIKMHINLEQIIQPELNAKLVAENIALQLVKRISFRRAMKKSIVNARRLGAEGVKVCISGRLDGAEIARTEWLREGRVPLQTFSANIDYGLSEAVTTYGVIGVKVWIYVPTEIKPNTLGATSEKPWSKRKPRTKQQ